MAIKYNNQHNRKAVITARLIWVTFLFVAEAQSLVAFPMRACLRFRKTNIDVYRVIMKKRGRP